MTNTVFPTFQTQYCIYLISHEQAAAEYWDLPNTEILQSIDVASEVTLSPDRRTNFQPGPGPKPGPKPGPEPGPVLLLCTVHVQCTLRKSVHKNMLRPDF
jgi:hypothetical protein